MYLYYNDMSIRNDNLTCTNWHNKYWPTVGLKPSAFSPLSNASNVLFPELASPRHSAEKLGLGVGGAFPQTLLKN